MTEDEKVVIRERRRSKRIKAPIKFRMIAEDASHYTEGKTKDLSCIGASCTMDKPIEEMTRLRLTLNLPDNDVVFDGVVVRCEMLQADNYEIGIYFSSIDMGVRKKIDNFINGREKKIDHFKIDG